MARKRAVLVGWRGHSPRWFEFHGRLMDIVAIAGEGADRVRGRIEKHAWNGKIYDDPAEMIATESADFALLWPGRTEDHVPLGLKALDRGMHVMLEKPLSEDPAEALAFVEAAERADRRAMIMQNIRWQNPAREIREVLDQGRLGQLYWLEVGMRGLHHGFIYEGIHIVDLARYWFDRPPRWVLGAGASPAHRQFPDDNLIALTIGFEGGGVARALTDWSSVGHHHWIEARLQGDRGVLVCDVWAKPTRFQAFGEEAVELPKWPVEYDDMEGLLKHFLDCIDAGRTPINSVRDQLVTLDIIFAARESMRRQQVVQLPFRYA